MGSATTRIVAPFEARSCLGEPVACSCDGSVLLDHEAGQRHAGEGVARDPHGVLQRHERQVVVGLDGLDLLVGELEREHGGALVLALELEEGAVADEASPRNGRGVGQLAGLLEALTDGRDELGLAVLDEPTRQLPVVLVALEVEAVRLEHHHVQAGGQPGVADHQ